MQRWVTSLKKILQYLPEFLWLTYLDFLVHLSYSSIDLLAVEQNLAEKRRQKVTQYWMLNSCFCLPEILQLCSLALWTSWWVTWQCRNGVIWTGGDNVTSTVLAVDNRNYHFLQAPNLLYWPHIQTFLLNVWYSKVLIYLAELPFMSLCFSSIHHGICT